MLAPILPARIFNSFITSGYMGKFFHRRKGSTSKASTPNTSRASIDQHSTPLSSKDQSIPPSPSSHRSTLNSTSQVLPDHDEKSSSPLSRIASASASRKSPEFPQPPVVSVTMDDVQGQSGTSAEGTNANGTQLSLPQADASDKHSQNSKKEKQGLFSSLVSAAHNAATIISSSMDDDKRAGLAHLLGHRLSLLPRNASSQDLGDSELNHNRSFSNKLDFLLKPAKFHGLQSSASSLDVSTKDHPAAAEQANGEKNENNDASADTPEKQRSLSPSNVHFESVREAPIKTLGNGNLLLGHFLSNRPQLLSAHTSTDSLPIKRGMSPLAVNSQLPPLSQLAVSGAGDTKKVRRKSYLSPARSQEAGTRLHSAASDTESDTESVNMDDELDQIIDYSGLTFASEKANKEFHLAFRDLPSNERLVSDFSCALSREILVHGRMYLSEHYVCFNSSILGWVTNIRIPLQEVIQIEKKSTAKLFPNGMIVRTLHHKYVFASFLSRDSVFKLVTNAWHRVLLELADVDPKKVVTTRGRARSRSLVTKFLLEGMESDEENSTNSEEVSNYSERDNADTDESSIAENESSDSSIEVKAQPENNLLSKDSSIESDKEQAQAQPEGGSTFRGLPSTGPVTHEPTDIDYTKQSLETFICDETINAPLGVVYLLLFGADSSKYIKVLKNQKNFEIDELGIVELSKSNKSRHYTYIKPLSGPIGPKQTKCIIDDKLIEYNCEKYILVEQDTATPDVPNGNAFKVKTKMFMSWAANNSTRLYVVTSVEWSGKSWIKGAIEKGSIDGQKESMKLMIETINDFVATAGSKGDKMDKKKKKRRKSTSSGQRDRPAKESTPPVAPPASIFEQLSSLMESIGGVVPIPGIGPRIVGLLISTIAFFLFSLILGLLFRSSSTPLQILSLSNMITQVKINDNTYTMIPSVDSYLADRKKKLDTELTLWKWINDRSDGHIRIESQPESTGNTDTKLQDYSAQELREIVRITQLKLNELSKRLDSDNM